MKIDTVYYLAYGSNLLRSRFQEYLDGYHRRDAYQYDPAFKEAPESFRVSLPLDIYFSVGSARWGGGIAFLNIESRTQHNMYRAYKLSTLQFLSVFSQENGFADDTLDWDELLDKGYQDTITGTLYDRIVLLGVNDNTPILTFTQSRPSWRENPPGDKYIDVISRGLAETEKQNSLEVQHSVFGA